MELQAGLSPEQDLEALKREQEAANALKDETSRYGGLMKVAQGLSFNKDVEGPEAFLKQQMALADQPVTDVKDRQKAELTAAEAVREHMLKGLGLGQKEKELGANLELGKERNQIAAGAAALENAHKTEAERLAQAKLDQDRDLAEGKLLADAGEKKTKQAQALDEVAQRKNTIVTNIDKAIAMIDKAGTYEALGPHNKVLDGIMSEVATDAAKLSDPQSVARPSEVEGILANLVKSGAMQQNSTAKKVLQDFKARMEDRAAEAYRVRGIEAPASAPGTPVSGVSSPEQRRKRLQEIDAELAKLRG